MHLKRSSVKWRPFCLGGEELTNIGLVHWYIYTSFGLDELTHIVAYVCASVNWVIIGLGNALSPIRRQAITWANDELLSYGQTPVKFE